MTDRVYSVRGVELANMTVVSDKGICADRHAHATTEAAASLALIISHLGDRPVTGVIYTRSHVDHYVGPPA